MALRVLLADESSTIKKVMQLTLQDFAVDVKAVPIGLDVLQVAQSYKPDIVFADVLLQKRSGYDVAADIKNDTGLRSTPVVLMWSGFMDIDEARAQASKADARLEKPFDAETLRALVKKLVNKTSSQKLSEYLSFPDLPEFVEAAPPMPATPSMPAASSPATAAKTPPQLQRPQAPPQQQAPQNLMPEATTIAPMPKRQPAPAIPEVPVLPEVPEADEFIQVPLKTPQTQPKAQESWSHQDLNKFKIDLPEVELDEVTVNYVIPEGAIDETNIVSLDALSGTTDEKYGNEEFSDQFSYGGSSAKKQTPERTEIMPQTAVNPNISIDNSRIEEIVRTQAREIIESVVWKIIPDIAERVIREELEKVLKESDKLRNP